MTCPICDQKPMNCDCSETERDQFDELEDLQEENEEIRRSTEGIETLFLSLHYAVVEFISGRFAREDLEKTRAKVFSDYEESSRDAVPNP